MCIKCYKIGVIKVIKFNKIEKKLTMYNQMMIYIYEIFKISKIILGVCVQLIFIIKFKI